MAQTNNKAVTKGAPAPAAGATWGGEVAERSEWKPFEAGVYGFEISAATDGKTKAGAPNMAWDLKAINNNDPEVDGKQLCKKFVNLVASSPDKQAKMNGILQEYATALGIPFPKKPEPINAKKFIGKRAYGLFKETTYESNKGPPGNTDGRGLELVRMAKTRAELEE